MIKLCKTKGQSEKGQDKEKTFPVSGGWTNPVINFNNRDSLKLKVKLKTCRGLPHSHTLMARSSLTYICNTHKQIETFGGSIIKYQYFSPKCADLNVHIQDASITHIYCF